MTGIKITPLRDTNAFQPLKVGRNTLSNRIVFAPSTRFRATEDHTPSDLQFEYYDKRSQYPGSLITTEATFVSEQGGGYPQIPGIWNEKHAQAWKKIVDRVHQNGSFIACQFWYLGRVAFPDFLKEHGLDLIAPSVVYEHEQAEKTAKAAGNPLREMKDEEIDKLIDEEYPNAASQALAAGFDYIEIHSAHGYLVDQFLQPVTNRRSGKYGGSIENRARLVLALVDRLTEIVGAHRLGIRISPWAKFQGMKADEDSVHPLATFSYLVHELQKRANEGRELAYISLVEPRVQGGSSIEESKQVGNNTFVRQIWKGNLIRAGAYSSDAPDLNILRRDIKYKKTLIGFSRYYISNPDLVNRLKEGYELTPYDRPTFYTRNNWGYNTYSNYGEENTSKKEIEINRLAKEISRL